METMGNRIKNMLAEKNMTQKSLAEKVGCTEAAISLYISGNRMPRANTLSQIALALDTTSDYLVEGVSISKSEELAYARQLIAQNVDLISLEDRKDLIRILINDDKTLMNEIK